MAVRVLYMYKFSRYVIRRPANLMIFVVLFLRIACFSLRLPIKKHRAKTDIY